MSREIIRARDNSIFVLFRLRTMVPFNTDKQIKCPTNSTAFNMNDETIGSHEGGCFSRDNLHSCRDIKIKRRRAGDRRRGERVIRFLLIQVYRYVWGYTDGTLSINATYLRGIPIVRNRSADFECISARSISRI